MMLRFLRRIPVVVYVLILVLGDAPASRAAERKHSAHETWLSGTAYREWLTYLASDELEGRGTGQQGIDVAAEFIADAFEQFGVEPAGDDDSYFQNFTMPFSELGPGNRLAVGTHGRRTRIPLRIGEDFVSLPFSAAGPFQGDVVFAGYGIADDEEGYDDFEGLEVEGKVLLMLRGGPDFGEFDMRAQLFQAKAKNAFDRRAAAVLIVNKGDDDRGLYDFGTGFRSGRGASNLPMLHITQEVADDMLAAAGMPGIHKLQAHIEDQERPASAPLSGVSVRGLVDVASVDRPVRNVVGMIPGQGPDADEIIVLGGHYDHLGIRRKGMPDFDALRDISNGADDNASGTSLVMALAKVFTEGPAPNRSLLLILFTGEELGLHGSRHFVKHPTVDLEKCVAMLNFDMVGRLKDDRLTVGGMRTGGLEELVTRLAAEYDLEILDGGGGRGPSDHTNFYNAEIPVLFFFTGLHREYHKPGDDTHLLNFDGAMRVGRLAADVIDEIDAMNEPPVFTKDTRRTTISRQDRAAVPAAGPGGRVRLGIMPAPDERPGILVAEIVDDSPASRAGLEEGDRIVKIGDSRIEGIEELVETLGRFREGDSTTLTIVRGENEMTLDVQFGDRAPAEAAGPEPDGPAEPVRLGIYPDVDAEGRGILVAQVVPDSPAAKASIKPGDRIVRIGEKRVNSLEDATAAMSRFRPGDETKIRVLRDDEPLELQVTFGGAEAPAAEGVDPLDQVEGRLRKLADRLLDEDRGREGRRPLKVKKSDGALELTIELDEFDFDFSLVSSFLEGAGDVLEESQVRDLKLDIDTSFSLRAGGKPSLRIKIRVARKAEAAPRAARRDEDRPRGPRDQTDDDAEVSEMPPVRLGIMPTYHEGDGQGYEIEGVLEGGPAAKAGMRDSDRIYSIGDKKVTNIHEYMDALRSYRPGAEIPVTVIRDGKKIRLTVKAAPARLRNAA